MNQENIHWHKRRVAIATEYLKGGKTYKQVAQIFGISSDRISQITRRMMRHRIMWWTRVSEKKFPIGVLRDPDGLNDYQEEMSYEQQYYEIENERSRQNYSAG